MDGLIKEMLEGSIVTIEIFFLVIVLSVPLGLCITFLYMSKNVVVQKVTAFYILLMRGTPLLLQLFFFYYGLPYIPVIGKYLVFTRFWACIVAFVLNYAAYFAEIFRGGLLAVDIGQYEAAKVLGFTKFQTLRKIVIPQMFRVTLPSISNEAIILVKDTALVSAISVAELLKVTNSAVSSTASVTPFFIAGIFYLVMSYVVTVFFKFLERKYAF
ncbi:MAG: amino acid ABC transporter permease [Lachnospirales bacterium]